MKKIRFCVAVVLIATLAGCAVYTPVDSRKTISGLISVEPDRTWSRRLVDGRPTWTVYGIGLDILRFDLGIPDGQPVFPVKKKDEYPVFRSSMQSSEIADLLIASISRQGMSQVELVNLEPAAFDSLDGFRLTLSFYNDEGLRFRGLVLGAVDQKQRLHLISFYAPELHYFESLRPHVEAIFSSVRFLGGR